MIHDMVTSTVTIPTGTLAVLAQRLVKMRASPSTWVSPRAKVRRAVSADILQMFRASCRPALETARKALGAAWSAIIDGTAVWSATSACSIGAKPQ